MHIRLRKLGGRIGKSARKNLGAACDILDIRVNGKRYVYMIDCGMEAGDELGPNKGPMEIAKLSEFPPLNGVFVSHAHRDHLAAIFCKNVYSRFAPDARLFVTKPTNAFLPCVGHDQLKVSRMRGEKPPYGDRDIMKVMALVKDDSLITRPGYIPLVPGSIEIFADGAGHIRGAACFYFVITEGKKRVVIYFSGDNATHNQGSTLGAPLPPNEDLYPDIIASFDCTNGSEDLAKGTDETTFWSREMERMADAGHNTVKAGKTAFFWTFSIDRSQTFASELARRGLLTYLDGPSAIKYSRIMQSENGFWCEGDRPLDMDEVRVCEEVGEPVMRGEACAIVAPSGMGHGPAASYIAELAGKEGNHLAASGFQAEGTNGWRIVKAKRGDKIKLETGDPEEPVVEVTIAANIDHYRPSGHSLRGSALERIERLFSRASKYRVPMVGLAHATTGAFKWFEHMLSGSAHTFRADREKDRDIVLVD